MTEGSIPLRTVAKSLQPAATWWQKSRTNETCFSTKLTFAKTERMPCVPYDFRVGLPDRGASSEVSRSTVRCVERKGVCGQKGALVSASAPRLRSLFVVSSVKACVDRRVLSSQLLPLAYARSGSNLSTKPPFWQLCLLADAARTCREGPELRTLDQALRARRTAGRNLALLLLPLLLTSSSEIDLGGNLALIASLTRVLRSSFCWRLLHGRAERGPELRTLDRASARQADSETQLGSPCTASPRPLLLESPSEDSQPRVRCVERKGVCGRRVLSSQLLPLAYARSGSNLSTKPPFWQLCLLADAARTCREGPTTPNSRPSSASQADSGTQLGSSSTASPPHKFLGNRSRGKLALIASPY
ncbi:hypothetical protein Avbf_02500 [Armadillidium vulgare]|nr:hypothetical protein Avbf_02500 [Armadillidium vulgare]